MDNFYDDQEYNTSELAEGGTQESRPADLNLNSSNELLKELARTLVSSKNMILRGAPGTGKSFLAKSLAAYIVTSGETTDFSVLDDTMKKRVEFVQFHPSYDYSDFVEGIRPKLNETNDSIGFEVRDGIFKRFIQNALDSLKNNQEFQYQNNEDDFVRPLLEDFLSTVELGVSEFKTKRGNVFQIRDFNENEIHIYIPQNPKEKNVTLESSKLSQVLDTSKKMSKVAEIRKTLGSNWNTQEHSYYYALYEQIMQFRKTRIALESREERISYVFIIDEINRGEISKIFGELFFAIDPGYRGEAGKVSTQYSNWDGRAQEPFYIPNNVYIIGTMNDIDRSVDTFDFAMRRRFRFKEITAEDSIRMLDCLKDRVKKNEAIGRMRALNQEIRSIDELGANYEIGAAYFLKLDAIGFDELWTDYLRPLLEDYVRGMHNEVELMQRFAEAYGAKES